MFPKVIEMIMKRFGLVFFAIVVLVSSATVLPADGPVKLKPRYSDVMNGFSLCPPADSQRKREFSPNRLASWVRRDRRTGAIDLTLTVLKMPESKKIDLKSYSKAMIARHRRERKFLVDSIRLITVNGKGAIDLRGGPGGKRGLWQRQVWIAVQDKLFLVLIMSGPKGTKNHIDSCSRAVLDSLRYIDTVAALKKRKENAHRGEILLTKLTDKKLSAVFRGPIQWYLLRMKGKDVGYVTISLSITRSEGVKAYEVRTQGKVHLPGQALQRVERSQRSAANRKLVQWHETLTVANPLGTKRFIEKGIVQNKLIVCNRRSGTGQDMRRKKRMKQSIMNMYLPDAFRTALPTLVDLKKKTTYSFATYSSQANDFKMLTFVVIGPEKITVAGRQVEAIRVSEQASVKEEPANMWVNSAGQLLKMTTADGLIMETTTRSAIIRRFGEDEAATAGNRE